MKIYYIIITKLYHFYTREFSQDIYEMNKGKKEKKKIIITQLLKKIQKLALQTQMQIKISYLIVILKSLNLKI